MGFTDLSQSEPFVLRHWLANRPNHTLPGRGPVQVDSVIPRGRARENGPTREPACLGSVGARRRAAPQTASKLDADPDWVRSFVAWTAWSAGAAVTVKKEAGEMNCYSGGQPTGDRLPHISHVGHVHTDRSTSVLAR